MTTTLHLSMAGARLRFTCDHEGLGAYARAHLTPSLIAVDDEKAAPADIVANVRWHEGHPPQQPAAAYAGIDRYERLDRDLFGGEGELLWLRVDDMRDLHLRFSWDGTRLGIEGDFYHRLSKRPRADLARRLIFRRQMDGLRRKRFTRLLYYLVYYPIFWWMEHVQRAHPIHAGAVDTPQGAVVLAGPSGVGKSTLTVALAATPGARMLSDTFVLHRGADLWGVPEPLLLDRWSRSWLGEAAESLSGIPEQEYMLGRGGYVVPPERLVSRARATVVVLPRRAPARFVREIAPGEAIWRVDAYNDIVNDLRRYRAFAAVLELLDPSGLARSRLESLDQLAVTARWYEVGLTREIPRAEVVSLVLNLCQGSNGHRSRRPISHHG